MCSVCVCVCFVGWRGGGGWLVVCVHVCDGGKSEVTKRGLAMREWW